MDNQWSHFELTQNFAAFVTYSLIQLILDKNWSYYINFYRNFSKPFLVKTGINILFLDFGCILWILEVEQWFLESCIQDS